MLDLRQQKKSFKESKPFHSLLNVSAFITDTAFLTKSGDVGLAIEFKPHDAECLDPEQIDALVVQITSAMKVFDENFVVSTYLLKSSNPPLTAPQYENAIVDEAVRSRLEHLRKKGAHLYSFEGFLIVVFKSKWITLRLAERFKAWAKRPRKALRESLKIEDRALALDATIEGSLKALQYAVTSFLEQTSDVLRGRILHKKEAFSLIRRLVNPRREKADSVLLTSDLHVDYWTCDSELEVHPDHLRLEEHFVKVLTLKRPPARTFAQMLRELQRVPADMVIVTEWNVCENSKAIADIRSKQLHHHKTKMSLLSQVGSDKPYERELLFDGSKEALVEDLGNCLKDIEMKGHRVGYFSLTVNLFGPTFESVERSAAEVMKTFGVYEGALNEERYNALNAFVATVPGGYPFNLRRLLTTNQNHGDLCPWFLPAAGEKRSAFLGRESVFPLETEEKSLFFYNLHVEDVGHTIIVGPTGTGKSFLINFLITHLQAYDLHTSVFGIGGDFRWLTERFGGSYVQCRPGQHPSINPYLLEPTASNLEFQFAFTKVLSESSDFRLSDSNARELFDVIRHLPVLPPELRRLSTVATTVCKAVGDHLRQWTEGEQYGAWFDNPTDTVTHQRFQYVDFEGMEGLDERAREALVFYLLHRKNEVIYDEHLRTTLKVFFIDEAWRFLKHPVTRAYITEALKTWRKKNAAVILSTQSVKDLAGEDVLRPIAENCPTKILLANPRLDPAVYADVFGLNETEQERVRSLVSKRQFLLKREKLSKVLNLTVDPKSYWLFTTNPFEAKRRDDVITNVGLHAALEVLGKESI